MPGKASISIATRSRRDSRTAWHLRAKIHADSSLYLGLIGGRKMHESDGPLCQSAGHGPLPMGSAAREGVVVQAPAPTRLIEGGHPIEATVAQVLVSKYADHLPLYRQAQIYVADVLTRIVNGHPNSQIDDAPALGLHRQARAQGRGLRTALTRRLSRSRLGRGD